MLFPKSLWVLPIVGFSSLFSLAQNNCSGSPAYGTCVAWHLQCKHGVREIMREHLSWGQELGGFLHHVASSGFVVWPVRRPGRIQHRGSTRRSS